MAKKVNMFKADRALAVRVSEFMEFHMSKITDSRRHSNAVRKIQDQIQCLRNCEGSALDRETTDHAISVKYAEIEAENKRYADACAAKDKWVWSVEDVTVYDAVSKFDNSQESKEVLSGALCDWLNAWGLGVSGNENILLDIAQNIGGKRFSTARKIVNSGATEWVSARTKADVLKTLYGTVAQYMVNAGTLKAVQIPDDIREAYAPKAKKSAK